MRTSWPFGFWRAERAAMHVTSRLPSLRVMKHMRKDRHGQRQQRHQVRKGRQRGSKPSKNRGREG